VEIVSGKYIWLTTAQRSDPQFSPRFTLASCILNAAFCLVIIDVNNRFLAQRGFFPVYVLMLEECITDLQIVQVLLT